MARPKDLINTKKAARLLHLHISGVRRWIREGKLSGVHVGGRWYVSKAEVKRRREYKPATVALPPTRTELAAQVEASEAEAARRGF